jgi:hypothetical protein
MDPLYAIILARTLTCNPPLTEDQKPNVSADVNDVYCYES